MSDVFSQIGQFLSSGGGKAALTGGTAGVGLLQNLFANREAEKKQKFVEDLISNPAKFNAYVAGFNKPLSAGLTADVARQTDAYGAERGLGSSPAIMKDVYAQALAPYYLQQQNDARSAALQALGIYEQSPTTKPIDLTGVLKAIQGMPGSTPNPTAGIDLSTVPNPSPFGPLEGAQPTQLPPSLVSGGADPFSGITGEG